MNYNGLLVAALCIGSIGCRSQSSWHDRADQPHRQPYHGETPGVQRYYQNGRLTSTSVVIGQTSDPTINTIYGYLDANDNVTSVIVESKEHGCYVGAVLPYYQQQYRPCTPTQARQYSSVIIAAAHDDHNTKRPQRPRPKG